MEADAPGALSTTHVSVERVERLLSQGRLELVGRIRSSSNIIFLARVADDEVEALAIYKPRRGERPLWDFPAGTLYLREVAAYVLSRALGWPLIPPTVIHAGPYGPGALQLYIDADPAAHYFTFRAERLPALFPVALFDVLVNNADRKGGHLLLDEAGQVWAIDNALTFHEEEKLRSVVWDFAGMAIPPGYLTSLRHLERQLAAGDSLRGELATLLSGGEIAALQARLAALLARATMPLPDPARRQVPWPLI